MYYSNTSQIELPGIGNVKYDGVSPRTVLPGEKVVYVGRIDGGPGYGAVGNIIEIRNRKAVVEIKSSKGYESKIWYIPYCLLGSIKNAA
ncbi:MAG: hypothetical protein CL904_03635 [Dehalococcoidia bacterium]|nr:hypothetical protein [Dehalococcoidia bacterium]MQG15794.1 hypothetical protein [SAR202 cluster bacterium]